MNLHLFIPLLFIVLFSSFSSYSQCANDSISPTAVCQDITIHLAASGYAHINPLHIDNGSTDNCGITNYLVNGQITDTFSCDDIGSNSVILTVIDSSGNVDHCTAVVTVVDLIAPNITCIDTVSLPLDSNSLAFLTPNLAISSVSDNCNIINWGTLELFDCNDVGSPRTVTMTATDMSGNQSSCSTVVYTREHIAPVAICQNITLALSPTGFTVVYPHQIDNGSFDNCGIMDYWINGVDSFILGANNIGVNTVVLTVRDSAGNTANCVATVTIVDLIAPIASCRSIVNAPLNTAGVSTVSAIDLDHNSSDNIGITSYLIDGLPSKTFNCNDVGNTPATLYVMDASGNVDTCYSTIKVTDPLSSCLLANSSILAASTANEITIFPNPTKGNLNINSSDAPLEQLTLKTITGKTVLEQSINQQMSYELDLKELPNAIYLLTVKTTANTYSKKIILQE
ncbi:T9SS type A sorting domain-containing protein [Aureispira anguillae]|uniref:T9SS type A sorting domain-containing protein n=1 Tax=Aureispira anguillae TaxID=2864201 RepID=A0A915YGB4_9BACT|nr:T9SS type A sorting domain-containing protein [Aureispira anguillae]BDS12466.1 T9SS type A sorting domain-containing protein [Aureispira anguillae]